MKIIKIYLYGLIILCLGATFSSIFFPFFHPDINQYDVGKGLPISIKIFLENFSFSFITGRVADWKQLLGLAPWIWGPITLPMCNIKFIDPINKKHKTILLLTSTSLILSFFSLATLN